MSEIKGPIIRNFGAEHDIARGAVAAWRETVDPEARAVAKSMLFASLKHLDTKSKARIIAQLPQELRDELRQS